MGRIKVYSSDAMRREAQNERRRLARQTQSVGMRNPLTFTGVDGEGTGRNQDHKYVLLGIGENQIEDRNGLWILDIFKFLYSQFQEKPQHTYAGYYLSYDFIMWLKQLPENRAWYLLSKQGIAKRQRTRSGGNTQPFPVHWKDWEFDMLGMKRFKLRPYGEKSWLYVCDAGPFFQTSFIKAIDPSKWSDPIVTEEEYAIILEGKASRGSASLGKDMRFYNVLENRIFSRLLGSLSEGLDRMGVRLGRDQWFGPGQAAQAWLTGQKNVPTAEQLSQIEPILLFTNSGAKSSLKQCPMSFKKILDVGRLTYYGGWFEIFAHGHIPGETWEYDINSAYPYIASQLPCLKHGKWTFANGPTSLQEGCYRITHATVRGKDKHIGAMLHRHPDGRIVRPLTTGGYYWQHELDAATRAGLIDYIEVKESWTYEPCDCENPLSGLSDLYDLRVDIGKDTPVGKGAKLVYNSAYGKFSQSVGNPKYGNSLYASLITSGCRTMILDAIASHPKKTDAVVMVATDGVYFTEKHTGLNISNKLGEWSESVKEQCTLFKPGMYWDNRTREQIANDESPVFKTRGISAKDFAKQIEQIDSEFSRFREQYQGIGNLDDYAALDFPKCTFKSSFGLVTCQQAIARSKWETAGKVFEPELRQDSDPVAKRDIGWFQDGIYWSKPYDGWWGVESIPYDQTFGQGDTLDPEEYGVNADGYILDIWSEILHAD